MKNYLGFLKKEFYHIIRDFRTLMLLFGLPVAQILIFGYVIRNEILDVKIAILDNSRDEVTREITSKILSSDFFINNISRFWRWSRCRLNAPPR